jgi:hypothetical protein
LPAESDLWAARVGTGIAFASACVKPAKTDGQPKGDIEMKRLWIAIVVTLGFAAAASAQGPTAKTAKLGAAKPAAEKPSEATLWDSEAKPGVVKPAEVRPLSAKASPGAEPYTISPGELKPTPEMWFYEQALRQYQDPKMAVRRAAEFRADQRQRRIASSQWFGYSNSRPRVSCDPYNGDYAPTWTGNNSYYPNRWMGGADSLIIVQPNGYSVR